MCVLYLNRWDGTCFNPFHQIIRFICIQTLVDINVFVLVYIIIGLIYIMFSCLQLYLPKEVGSHPLCSASYIAALVMVSHDTWGTIKFRIIKLMWLDNVVISKYILITEAFAVLGCYAAYFCSCILQLTKSQGREHELHTRTITFDGHTNAKCLPTRWQEG